MTAVQIQPHDTDLSTAGHTTGAGVGYYGENLPIPAGAGTHPSAAHHFSTTGSATRAEKDAVGGAYVGGPAQDALTGKSKLHSPLATRRLR